ncbi:MAG: hypothetical protein GY929_25285 [Actinomycetia bacterium]|nr:hypothetical protein [Actinomycetes bacterium]
MSIPPKKRSLVVASVVAMVLLAGCGGGSDDSESSDSDTDTPSEGVTELTVVATEFAYDPDGPTIAADTDVSVTLQNDGVVAHDWFVLEEGVTIESESEFDESTVIFKIEQIEGGESETASVNLPAGSYQIICAVTGHLDAGMEQSITAS